MSKIGLYVYRLQLSDSQEHHQIPLTTAGVGSELHEFIAQFVRGKAAKLQDKDTERSWRLEPAPDEGRSRHGIIRYGTYGYSSNIVGADDNAVLLSRNATDVEEIPLYYRFWVPNAGHFGFAVLQSFGDKSCVRLVVGTLTNEFNRAHNHVRLTALKVMPDPDVEHRNAQVKKLILSKKRVPKDRAEILRDFSPEELNVELYISTRKNDSLGILSKFSPQIRGAREGRAFLLDGIEFDEASAIIAVGNSYMKVGIFGPSNSAGVIDITDDVELGSDQHPTLDSMAKVSDRVIESFREEYGMK